MHFNNNNDVDTFPKDCHSLQPRACLAYRRTHIRHIIVVFIVCNINHVCHYDRVLRSKDFAYFMVP